jgi:hypothetical protein
LEESDLHSESAPECPLRASRDPWSASEGVSGTSGVIQEPERAPGPSRRDISIWKLLCGDARTCISGVAGSELRLRNRPPLHSLPAVGPNRQAAFPRLRFRRLPRIVSSDAPHVPFGIAAGKSFSAVILFFQVHQHFRAGGLGARVDGVDIGDDHV